MNNSPPGGFGEWKQRFWIKRFVVAFIIASNALGLVQYLKGSTILLAIQYGLIWGGVSAGLFTLIGYVRYRRNPACMLPHSGKTSVARKKKAGKEGIS